MACRARLFLDFCIITGKITTQGLDYVPEWVETRANTRVLHLSHNSLKELPEWLGNLNVLQVEKLSL